MAQKTEIGNKESLTSLEKQVNEMLLSKIGGMSLANLQNVTASMVGRLLHESNNSKSVDLCGDLISELQEMIVAKRGELK